MADHLVQTVLRVATAHHGVLTRHQLHDLGCTDHQMARLVRIGLLTRAGRGIYAVQGALDSWLGRQAAAQVRAGPAAVASHRAAARLWGLDLPGHPRPELSVPAGTSTRGLLGIVHESTDLALAGARPRNGFLVTSLERTLIDLGAVVTPSLVSAAVDQALRERSTTIDRLADALHRHARRGRAGVGALRRVLAEHGDVLGRTDSELERLLLAVITEAGLPQPVTQHEVCSGAGAFVARIDLAYPDLFVGIEADSERWHSDRHRFIDDRERRDRLQALGWRMLGFTWHHVTREPGFVVDTIAGTCEAARRHAS